MIKATKYEIILYHYQSVLYTIRGHIINIKYDMWTSTLETFMSVIKKIWSSSFPWLQPYIYIMYIRGKDSELPFGLTILMKDL